MENKTFKVLILILMECLLRNGGKTYYHMSEDTCLNPYSNGMLTQLHAIILSELKLAGLNPYSNGMLTQSIDQFLILDLIDTS